MIDGLLTAELCFAPESATERNIKSAMKRILGKMIRDNILRRYSNLVLDEGLNVHVSIIDGSDGSQFDITLYYDRQ
jgi:hypothetical protein